MKIRIWKPIKNTKFSRGQGLIETAIVFPIILLLLFGLVEFVFIGRTYLALLEASVVGARLGTKGVFYYDDNEIFTLVEQTLDNEGYATSDLVDILVVRADLVDGTEVRNYRYGSYKSSGVTPQTTSAALLNDMVAGDPTIGVISVEVIYNHHLLFGFVEFVPDPIVLRQKTLQPVHPDLD